MSLEQIFSQIGGMFSSVADSIEKIFEPPTSLDDYYTIGKTMISKKIVHFVFIVLSILAALYLIFTVPEKISQYYSNKEDNKIYTKYYNSRSLKNYSGVAAVLSKKSEARYVGDVFEGVAQGKGVLYDKKSRILYDGDFVNNEYTGEGILYYKDGHPKYIGNFQSNKFSGVGKLYYDNHKLCYDGNFIEGLKNGEGVLCNKHGLEIFKGLFSDDRPSIEKYLSTQSVFLKDNFLETGLIYSCNNTTCIIYENLGVMIVLNNQDGLLNDGSVVEKIYILNNKYFLNEPKIKRDELDKKIDKIDGVKNCTGYTQVLFYEMSAIDYLRSLDDSLYQNFSDYGFSRKYSDVLESDNNKSSDKIYIQAYNINDLEYTFYFVAPDQEYVFYSIERSS
ncbi:MAG: hypothetical protein J6C55_01710 [Oscillospiraceae bacterium]|nr:hypothetical protein [Oscillospiraceae bacterium]